MVVATLSFLTSGKSIKTVYSENTMSIVNSTTDYLESYFEKYTVVLKDYSEDEVFSNESQEIKMYLEDRFNSLDSVETLYFASPDGKMIMAPSQELPDNYEPRERHWYQDALTSEKVVISKPYMDATQNQFIVSLSKKVTIDNKVEGVISLDLTLNEIQEILNDKSIGKEGFFFLTTNNGIILCHPDESLLGKRIGKEIDAGKLNQIIENAQSGVYDYEFNGTKNTVAIDKHNDWLLLGTFTNDEIAPYAVP